MSIRVEHSKVGERTGITTSNQEHGDVATTNRERRNTDDVSEDDTPPGRTVVEEPLSSAVYSLHNIRIWTQGP